jgi:hypothetical protein
VSAAVPELVFTPTFPKVRAVPQHSAAVRPVSAEPATPPVQTAAVLGNVSCDKSL